MIQVYVISLLAEELRRSHILKECNQYGLNPTVIDAVDMRNAGNREVMQKSALPLKKSKRKQRRLSRGETGCALSHQAVYRKFLAGTESYALILEDDAEFIRNPAALLQENVLAAIQLQYQFDVLLLGYVKKRERSCKTISTVFLSKSAQVLSWKTERSISVRLGNSTVRVRLLILSAGRGLKN